MKKLFPRRESFEITGSTPPPGIKEEHQVKLERFFRGHFAPVPGVESF